MGIKFGNIDISKIKIVSGLTPRLPSAYQEVEYIQNSGTQYINTGLQVKNGYHFVAKLNSINSDNNNGGRITGGYLGPDSGITGGHARLYFGGVRSGGWNYGYLDSYSNGGTGSGSTGIDYDVEFSWISGDAFIKINGTSIYTSSSTYTTTLSGDCPLFAQYVYGSNPEPHPGLRVYSAKYYDSNNDLVRDLVPCYRIADGVIGMYDLVNDTFYTNAGSGTFTKGNDVYPELYKDIKKVYKGSTQVRPTLSPREPGVNTVAYYPLTSATTVNNQVSGGTNLTNSNVSFGVQFGVDCAYISGNADSSHGVTKYLYGNITGLPTGSSARTYSFWIYNDNANIPSVADDMYIFQGQASTNKMVFVIGGGADSSNLMISQRGTSGYFGASIRQQRCHNVITYDGTKFEWYVNGVSRGTWTYTINTSSNKFSIFGASENPAWNAFNGAMSKLILEDKAWTAQEIIDYYNLTKGNYGI